MKRADILSRAAPSLVGLGAFATVVTLFLYGEHSSYFRLLTLWGFEPFRFPFVDLSGSLAAWDCARKGLDVILTDPCDVLGRGYNYSPFWMSIDWIPLGQPDRGWMGLTLGVAFLASLTALPSALSVTETMVRIAAVLSTMAAFAIERANPDLLIFLLVIGAHFLLLRSAIARILGYSLAFLAGAIKYYPFVLLVLMFRERIRFAIASAFASLAALMGLYLLYRSQIHEGLPHIASGPPFGDMFGAKDLLIGLLLEFRVLQALPINPAIGAIIVAILIVSTILWMMVKLYRASDIFAILGRLDEPRRIALLAGAILISGCFFAGQSIVYRGIFLFLTIPGLSALTHDKNAGSLASAARLALIGIPLLMWSEAIRLWLHIAATGTYPPPGFHYVLALDQPLDFLAWLVREIGWWLLIGLLLMLSITDLVARPLNQLRISGLSLWPKA